MANPGFHDPWSPSGNLGNPLAQTPGFQREWGTLSSSSIDANIAATGSGVLVSAMPVGGSTADKTWNIYVWGWQYVNADATYGGGHLITEADEKLSTAIATVVSPFVAMFDSPIRLGDNENLLYRSLNGQASSWVTTYYIITERDNENP